MKLDDIFRDTEDKYTVLKSQYDWLQRASFEDMHNFFTKKVYKAHIPAPIIKPYHSILTNKARTAVITPKNCEIAFTIQIWSELSTEERGKVVMWNAQKLMRDNGLPMCPVEFFDEGVKKLKDASACFRSLYYSSVLSKNLLNQVCGDQITKRLRITLVPELITPYSFGLEAYYVLCHEIKHYADWLFFNKRIELNNKNKNVLSNHEQILNSSYITPKASELVPIFKGHPLESQIGKLLMSAYALSPREINANAFALDSWRKLKKTGKLNHLCSEEEYAVTEKQIETYTNAQKESKNYLGESGEELLIGLRRLIELNRNKVSIQPQINPEHKKLFDYINTNADNLLTSIQNKSTEQENNQ